MTHSTPEDGSPHSAEAVPATGKAGWRCFRALLPGFLLGNLEGPLVNVALPSIQTELQLSLSALGWVAMACLLPTAALSPLMGAIADRWGRRRIYIAGLMGVGVGAGLAALAPNVEMLLFARALQGIGAAAIIANGLAIVAEQFEPQQRGRALGLMTAAVGIGAIAAPPLSGAVAQFVGWRGVFALNLAAVGAGLAWVPGRVPPDPPRSARAPLPWGSALTLALSVGCGILAIWSLERWDGSWLPPTLLLGGAALLAVLHRTLDRRSQMPLLPASGLPLETRISLMSLLIGSTALAALGYTVPLLLAREYHLEGLALGLQIVPFPLGLVGGAILGGQAGDRLGTRIPVLAGATLFSLGVMAYDLTHLVALGVGGVGIGMFSVANNKQAVHGAGAFTGTITGLVGLLRLGGQVLGVAISGVILSHYAAWTTVDWIGWCIAPLLVLELLWGARGRASHVSSAH